MHVNNLFVCGPKFTVFSSSNVGEVVVDQLLFHFSICGSVSEIFAIKVESCQKSRKILDGFFALPNFRGQGFQNYTQVITPGSRHVVRKKNCEDTPTRPEVIDAQTLKFRPNFKCARLKFSRGTPVQ